MSLQEAIQTHRKRLNMSQDELGKQMLVSRQTVSLWETGQTVPTLDNLVRLGEIFSVSIDELLTGSSASAEESKGETCECRLTLDDLKERKRCQNWVFFKRSWVFGLVAVLFILSCIFNETSDTVRYIAIGYLIFWLISLIRGFINSHKLWKRDCLRLLDSFYRYTVCDDSLAIDIVRRNGTPENATFRFADVEKVLDFKSSFYLVIDGTAYFLRKDALKESSALFSYLYHNPSKIEKQGRFNGWSFASTALAVASLCSVLIALILVGIVSQKNYMFIQNMWLFWLLTPIPIASIVFGLMAKRKKLKWKKNVVIGIIMTVILGIYGTFSLVFRMGNGNVDNVRVIPWEKSGIYTDEDIYAAIDFTKEYFSANYRGCTLTEITYSGDGTYNYKANDYDDVIVLIITFDSPSSGDLHTDEGFIPNHTYSDFQIILVRDDGGAWEFDDCGYG